MLGYIQPIRHQSKEQQQRRERRLERYDTVRRLHALGWSTAAIAAETNMDPKTVRRFLRAKTFPERHPRRVQGSLLDPYKPYLLERWNEGCRTGAQLLREIRVQGYPGGDTLVNAFLAQVRQVQGLPPKTRMVTPSKSILGVREHTFTPRRAAWQILGRPEAWTAEERLRLGKLVEALPDIAQAVRLSQDFAATVRRRQSNPLDTWLRQAADSPYKSLHSFARGVQRDYWCSGGRTVLQME